MDSVPVDGAGQGLDSYNLLVGSVRQGLRRLAQCTTETVAQVATCPAGQLIPVTRLARRDKDRGWEFAYPASLCGTCPHRTACVSPKAKGKGRTVFIVPDKEKLIRNLLQKREVPAFEALLALRPLVERVISDFAQCGGKQAYRMGHDNVSFSTGVYPRSFRDPVRAVRHCPCMGGMPAESRVSAHAGLARATAAIVGATAGPAAT